MIFALSTGALVAIFGAAAPFLGAIGTLWVVKYSARAKRDEAAARVREQEERERKDQVDTQLTYLDKGQAAVLAGLKYSEEANAKLRVEIDIARREIETLKSELYDMRVERDLLKVQVKTNELECQRRLAAIQARHDDLQEQVRRLQPPGEFGDV